MTRIRSGRPAARAIGQAGSILLACLWLLLGAAQLAAGTSLVTTRGISMEPRFHTGDLAVVRTADRYRVGDVVAYRSSSLQTVVLHRIVAVEDGRFTFKGDNNGFLDLDTPTQGQFVGKLAVRIPHGGVWLKRLTSPPALAAFTFLLLAGGTTAVTRRRRRLERRLMSPRHRIATPASLSGLHPTLVPVAAGAAALGLAGVALAGVAWTRPTTTTVPADTTAKSTMTFDYTARVPRSAAYDGTTVTAPQPVFRTLTDAVDVGYAYRGRPGTITVDAELSTAGGWRSTVNLSPERPLRAEQKGVVRLQLSSIDQRAAAAALATGIPAGAVTVTVLPRIALDGGGTFAPKLGLTLDSATLKPADATMVATDDTTTTGTRQAPAQLGALGRSVGVTTARTASLVALALAALAGLVLLATARLTGPVAEADRIRARHKDLLLAVLPVTLTPGRPVVDVTDIEALVRLAQRYGLLVLHWERAGVTTYVVQDEGAVYRFRTWDAQSQAAPVLAPAEA